MKIKDVLPEYFRHLNAIGRSKKTIRIVRHDLKQLIRFLDGEGVGDLDQLTSEVLIDYQHELSFRLTAKGTLLTLGSQVRSLGTARVFTRYLKKEDYLLFDPGEKIQLPKTNWRLPKVILTRSNIRKLISSCKKNNQGFRDRVIIEILYDTAVRRSELTHMKVLDMDLSGGYIHVTGKGNRERVVPLSQRVCGVVREYLLHVRPVLLGKHEDTGYVILSHRGTRMTGSGLWSTIKKICKRAGMNRQITTHTFRHTCVTHMLKNGAPIRHLQQMLGHESLESTQVYTHVTINDLKEIHARYHPSGSTKV